MRGPAGDRPVSRAEPACQFLANVIDLSFLSIKLVRKRQKLVGGQAIEPANGQKQIPLFVKGDSLLPLAESLAWIGMENCFDITVHAFGAHPADFVLYEDDAVSDAFKAGRQNQICLHWDDKGYSSCERGNSPSPFGFKSKIGRDVNKLKK